MSMDPIDPWMHPDPLPSPCIGVCFMNPESALCDGCFRTLDEIKAWSMAAESERRAIWIDIQERQGDQPDAAAK